MLLFWNNVKEELDYKDMSQKELSASTDISYNTLQSWITKDRLPDAQDAVKIARALNVSVEKLVTGKEDISKDLNDEINALLHDVRHLSTDDFKIARTLIHRLSNQVRHY